MWWVYFMVPSGDLLHAHRERTFAWGYGHMFIYGSIAATGAGLHVAAYYITHEAHIGSTATVVTVAGPVALFLLATYSLYTWLVRSFDPFHLSLLAATAAVLVLAVVLATAGLAMAWCLVVLMVAPWVTVVGYETIGHRHLAAALERIEVAGAGTQWDHVQEPHRIGGS
jgi:low temperature requirement protein LtrA